MYTVMATGHARAKAVHGLAGIGTAPAVATIGKGATGQGISSHYVALYNRTQILKIIKMDMD